MTPEARAEKRFPRCRSTGNETTDTFMNTARVYERSGAATIFREQVEPLEEEIKMIETIGGLSFKPGRRPYELVAELAASRGDALSKIDELEADNAKLRALVQEAWPYMQHKAGCRAISFANSMLSHAPISQRTCTCGFDKLRASLAKSLKEQGFVPTNTEDK